MLSLSFYLGHVDLIRYRLAITTSNNNGLR